METGEYDEGHAVTAVAEAIRPHLTTDRLRLDQAATEDIVRIVRAVLRAAQTPGGSAQMNPELV